MASARASGSALVRARVSSALQPAAKSVYGRWSQVRGRHLVMSPSGRAPRGQQPLRSGQRLDSPMDALLERQQAPAPVRPIRTLSKGTLDSIIADVNQLPQSPLVAAPDVKDDAAAAAVPPSPESKHAECCSNISRDDASYAMGGVGDPQGNGHRFVNSLLRRDSFDVPAKLVQEDLKCEAFLPPLKDDHEAKRARTLSSEELKRAKRTHLNDRDPDGVEGRVANVELTASQSDKTDLNGCDGNLGNLDCVHGMVLDPLQDKEAYGGEQLGILQTQQVHERRPSLTAPMSLPMERMRSFQVGARAIEEEIAELQKQKATVSENHDEAKAKMAVLMKQRNMNATDQKRACTNCGRVNTPQWRIGPEGPKSLCNACGVHYRKFKQLPRFSVKLNAPET